MQKRSILHIVTNSNWDEQTIRVLAELEGLQAMGHEVFLIAHQKSEIFKRATEREIPVEVVAMGRPNIPRAILRITRIIRKCQADIVTTHTFRDHWTGAIAALLSRRHPIVIRTQHYASTIKKGFMSRLLYQKLSDYVITTSEALRKRLIAEQGFLPDRTVSIPTGVDPVRFNPNRYDPEMMQDELGHANGPRIAMTGVFSDGKDFHDFVAAAAEVLKTIPETRFYIVGTGLPENVRRVRVAVARYELQNDVFMLLSHPEDIPQILSAMDLLVYCPSDNSGLPQIVLQALVMGKPVVATRVGAIPEAVFNEVTGHLVSPHDVQSLADREIELLQDDLKRKAFGQAGRRLVIERYSLEGMVDQLVELYEAVIAKRDSIAVA